MLGDVDQHLTGVARLRPTVNGVRPERVPRAGKCAVSQVLGVVAHGHDGQTPPFEGGLAGRPRQGTLGVLGAVDSDDDAP